MIKNNSLRSMMMVFSSDTITQLSLYIYYNTEFYIFNCFNKYNKISSIILKI